MVRMGAETGPVPEKQLKQEPPAGGKKILFRASGLKDLGQRLQQERRAKVKERFDAVLGGKFDRVAPGNFKTNLRGLESVSVIPSPERKPGSGTDVIYAIPFYLDSRRKEKHVTLQILKDGTVRGDLPPELKLSNQDLLEEVLRIIEQVNLEFWHKTDAEILPLQDEGEKTQPGQEELLPREGPRIDPERMAFLEKQPGVLFGFVNKLDGFNGYRGTFFQNFVILENPTTSNAAFIVDLPEEITADRERLLASPSERDLIIENFWLPISRRARTKGELLALGAKRVVHTPDVWKSKMQREIDSHTKDLNAG